MRLCWICTLLIVLCPPALRGQQVAPTLTLVSAYDQQPGPFLRTEWVTLGITGGTPLTPITVLMGQPVTAWSHPQILGQPVLNPSAATPLAGLDGFLGFGGTFPAFLDVNGEFSFTFQIPPGFANPAPPFLPYSVVLQALTRPNPFPDPTAPLGGLPLAVTAPVTLTVQEPTSSPTITAIRVVDFNLQALPSVVDEGTTPLAIISGTGFLPESTVLPTVAIESTQNPTLASAATVLAIIDETPTQPQVTPAVLVRLPSSAGGILLAPATNAGPVRVRIAFGPTLYPINPGLGTSVTSGTSSTTDPTYLLYRSQTPPDIQGVTPRAVDINSTPCTPILILGNGFLTGAQVTIGGLPVPSTVVNGTLIQTPTLPAGATESLMAVTVTNVDSQTNTSDAAAELIAGFDFDPATITITSTTPTSMQEGTSGVTVQIQGTCPVVNTTLGGTPFSYSLLDPATGVTTAQMGALLGGMPIQLPSALSTTPTITGPGTFQLTVTPPPYPTGLGNLPGGSAGGLTNTGPKTWQIRAPLCVNPQGLFHRDLGAANLESANQFLVTSGITPQILGFLPTNTGRRSGGQIVQITGTGFLTNASTLPATSTSLLPRVLFKSPLNEWLPVPGESISMIDLNTLQIMTPVDMLPPGTPLLTDVMVVNPDLGMNPNSANDDFMFVADLAPAAANEFLPPAAGTTTTLLTDLGGPQIWTFPGDLTIPANSTLKAAGNTPLFIRVRGDMTLAGAIDLSGTSHTANSTQPPGTAPAGGSEGGSGTPMGTEAPLGRVPADPITLQPVGVVPASGGQHGLSGGGGGGGGHRQPGSAGHSAFSGAAGGAPGQVSDNLLPALPISTELLIPAGFGQPGGGGGGAGGTGTTGTPLQGTEPQASLAMGGRGGNSGGALVLVVEGHLHISGSIDVRGTNGAPGQVNGNLLGGGGGGGSGGSVIIVAIQGVSIASTARLDASGGEGGPGARDGGAFGGSGGHGAIGGWRIALPMGAQGPDLLTIDPAAVLKPVPDTTGY